LEVRASLPYTLVTLMDDRRKVSLESYFYKYVEPGNICFLVYSWDLEDEPWGIPLGSHDGIENVIRGYQAKIAELRRALEETYPREFRRHYRFRAMIEIARVFFGSSPVKYDMREANRLALSLRLCNYALGESFVEKAYILEAKTKWRNIIINLETEEPLVLDNRGSKIKSLTYMLIKDEGFRREVLSQIRNKGEYQI